MKIFRTLSIAILLFIQIVIAGPQAGSIGLLLNTTSVNNLMATFIPILAYYGLNNKTIELDIEDKAVLYKFTMSKIHLITVGGFKTKIFEEVPGTDKIHIKIGGVNILMDIDAELDALYFIPFKASRINITNLDIDLTIESTSLDQVHWQLSVPTVVTVGDVQIQMQNQFLNKIIKLSHKIIEKVIDNQLKNVGKLVDSSIDAFNKKIMNESDYTFDITPLGKKMPLNMTMTNEPIIKPDSHLIKLNFDGLFDSPQEMQNQILRAHDYFPDIEYTHRNQFWINQDTFNTFLSVGQSQLFPLRIDNQNISSQFLQLFPEIGLAYGRNCSIALELSLVPDLSAPPIQFLQNLGIALGQNNDMKTKLDIIVSNSSVQNQTAIKFEMNLMAAINFTMQNFIFYPAIEINQLLVKNTNITYQSIQLITHNYNQLFQSVFRDLGNSFNFDYKNGVPLAQIDPDLALISGLIKNSTMSPYISDGWMYAGFNMAADSPIKSDPVAFSFLQ